jgi:peroxiredoxin
MAVGDRSPTTHRRPVDERPRRLADARASSTTPAVERRHASRWRQASAWGGTVLIVAQLAACASATASGNEATTQPGYRSEDGATQTWPAGSRSGPVELSGTDADGDRQDVAAWRGDVVLLNTWYAACPPCRAEAPDLVAIAADYAPRGLRMLGVNSTDAVSTAQAFDRQFAVPYRSIIDTDGSAIAALQGVVPINAVPTTVLLDRDGRVAARVIGRVDPSTVRSLVDDLLDETGDASPSTAATSTESG